LYYLKTNYLTCMENADLMKNKTGLIKAVTTVIIFFLAFHMQGQDKKQNDVIPWSSRFVFYGDGGRLQYEPDSLGNLIPDFSHVGYMYGDEPIPDIPNVLEIEPVEGDNYTHIQNAINQIAEMPVDENGFRGALLLKKGTYPVAGSVFIQANGIVLRGEGSTDDENGTIILATGTSRRAVIDIGNNSGNTLGTTLQLDQATKTPMVESYVPVGRQYVKVQNPEFFTPGDLVALHRPGTQKWITDLKMDQIPQGTGTVQWTPQSYTFNFERIITHINGDTIFFRNPVVMAFDQYYGGGFVYKAAMERFSHIGVENLLLKSTYAYDTDEDHAWHGVLFRNVEHSWAHNVAAKHFAYAAIYLSWSAKHISVINCSSYEQKSQITGGRRYPFHIEGQLNLFRNCFANNGRHDYSTSARVRGPNVFTGCISEHSWNDSGPHHRWAMGTLYDSMVTNSDLNVQDRGNSGTGHGWAGVNQVFWNSSGKSSVCQNPWVSGVNYNIGWMGAKYSGWHTRPDGIWEGHNLPGLFPSSLYQAQLTNRTTDTRFFSVLAWLDQVTDSTYLLKFNMPVNLQEALDINNYVISGTAGVQELDVNLSLQNEKQILFTFHDIPLLSNGATILIDASLVISEEGEPLSALTIARHIEPDKRPKVYYNFQRVGNADGDYLSAISSKEGKLFLVQDKVVISSYKDLESAVEENKAIFSEVAEPMTTIKIYTKGLDQGKYFFYAVDVRGRISAAPSTFVYVDNTTLSIHERSSAEISITTGDRSFQVFTSLPDNFNIEVFDSTGKKVYSGVFSGSIDIKVDSSGLYIVRCLNHSRNANFKILVL
jgi:hypothetical protein